MPLPHIAGGHSVFHAQRAWASKPNSRILKNEENVSAFQPAPQAPHRFHGPHVHPRRSFGHQASSSEGPRQTLRLSGCRTAMPAARLTLKKSDKLRNRSQFEEARLHGVKLVGSFLLLVHLPASKVECGVICSKKYSLLSVERNRARRLLWEAFRLLKPRIQPTRLVLIARNRMKRCSGTQIREEVEKLLRKAELLKP